MCLCDAHTRHPQSIAARAGSSPEAADSFPCVRYVGPGGSGHYVKMVHNGIEYGDMQLIAEAAFFCREAASLSALEVREREQAATRGPSVRGLGVGGVVQAPAN